MAVRKTKAGLALKRWFKEDWKDVKTGKACGRQKGEGLIKRIDWVNQRVSREE